MNEKTKEKMLDCLGIVNDGENEKQYNDDDLQKLSIIKMVHDISIIKGCAVFWTVIMIVGAVLGVLAIIQ